jgi:hypothetical protein
MRKLKYVKLFENFGKNSKELLKYLESEGIDPDDFQNIKKIFLNSPGKWRYLEEFQDECIEIFDDENPGYISRIANTVFNWGINDNL